MTRAGQVLAALALTSALAAPVRADFDPDDDRAVRIAAESGIGLLSGAAGAFAGGLVGGGVCLLATDDGRDFGCLLPFFIGALAGEFVGIGLGTYAGGNLAGGNGGLGWTFLGEAGGALVAGVVVVAAEVDVGDLSWWLLTVGLPLAGAVVGYELSTHGERTPTVNASFTIPF